jgi:polyether ionophore transport system permease protein
VSSFAGTSRLIRLALRRDRVRLPVWVLAIGLSLLGSVASFAQAYPTAADRQARAAVLDQAVARLFVGPGYGSDHYTYGAMTANELLPSAAIAVALMSIFLVIRHTRAEEEVGTAEVVRATAVGRHAGIASSLIVVGGTQGLLFAILAVGLPASLEGLSQRGSLAFAGALLAVGLVFAGIAAVVAQLTVSARSAVGISAIVLGTTYLLRAIGDMGDSVLTWFSPVGWATEMRSFVDERWWPLALSAIASAALVAATFAINARRDVGAGLVGDRSGASAASELLGSPFGLALRLQRAGLIAWGASLLLLGLVYGWIAGDAGQLYEKIDALRDYLARIGSADPSDQYLALTMFASALIAVGFAIQASTRLRAEESAQRAEPILGTGVGRGRWAWSHLAIALGGSAAMLLVFGIGVGITRSIDAGEIAELPRLIGASLAYTPALWVFVGLVAALFGVAPRVVPAVWAVLGALAFVGVIGPLLHLPDWAFDLSPMEHVSRLPVAAFNVVPELVLTTIAGALVAIGIFTFRRRDIVAA